MTMKTSHRPPFALLFLLSFSCSLPNVSGKFHHLQLVYNWPNTHCLDIRVQCKRPVPQKFVLHGLWPADKAGKTLLNCPNTRNISSALTKYEKQLKKTCWISILRKFPNRQFWQYQWKKHGACVLPRMTLSQYFQVIIAQERKFDLLRALFANKIMPGASSHPRKSIEAAIRKQTKGKNFYISCRGSKIGVLIKEIYICLDGSGRKVIACPYSNRSRGCGRKTNLVLPVAVSYKKY